MHNKSEEGSTLIQSDVGNLPAVSRKFALYFHLGRRIRITRHLNRHLPNERFDPARAGVVFTTVKQRDLRANGR